MPKFILIIIIDLMIKILLHTELIISRCLNIITDLTIIIK